MVFRKDNKTDAFQRQISALRQQLGTDEEPGGEGEMESSMETETGFYEAPMEEPEAYAQPPVAAPPAAISMQTEPAPTAIPTVDGDSTVISANASCTGDLESQGTVHVLGRYKGGIKAQHTVFIAESADVDANIEAATVVVAGLLKGTVRSGTRFEVLPSGRVSGDVQSPTLVIHEGATVNGAFTMSAVEAQSPGSPAQVLSRRATRGTA